MITPSPCQLRRLWDLDNSCAHKYMDMPLRRCTSVEPPDEPGTDCLPEEMMSLLERQIKEMWRKMSTILEIFHEDDKPELGFRLRVKLDLPIKVSMKATDQLIMGWKAVIPKIDTSPSVHLYLRSDMFVHNQYLGGPVSYCNWAPPKSATLTVRQVSHGSTKHLVRAESKFLSSGSELLWDYGKREMPQFPNEKPECCSLRNTSSIANLPKKKKTTMEVYKELCVLCGQPYKSNGRDWTKRKCQKRVHFLGSHANYLGTDWDGCGLYDPAAFTVDYKRALLECERLCSFLKRLESDSWKVVPACAVMSKQERETLDPQILMNIFSKRSKLFKKLGTLLVRGNTTPSMVDHLYPIRPSPWNVIFPRGSQPTRTYALPKDEKTELAPEIEDSALQDVVMVLNIQEIEADESSSEEDESSSESDVSESNL